MGLREDPYHWTELPSLNKDYYHYHYYYYYYYYYYYIEIVVWMYDTFDNNLRTKNSFLLIP